METRTFCSRGLLFFEHCDDMVRYCKYRTKYRIIHSSSGLHAEASQSQGKANGTGNSKIYALQIHNPVSPPLDRPQVLSCDNISSIHLPSFFSITSIILLA